MLKYNFQEMMQFYDSQKDNSAYFTNDENMIAIFITPAQKFEKLNAKQIKKQKLSDPGPKMGNIAKFIKQNINMKNIRKINFIENKHMYPNGLYIVKQDQNNIFFVFPTLKTNLTEESIICDHYSFPYVPHKDEIHLHMTMYIPYGTDIEIGQTNHYPRQVIKNGIELPKSGYENNPFNPMGPLLKNDILDLCRVGCQHGGARKTRTKSSTRSTGVSIDLERALIKNKIKNINAFGYKHDNKWHFIVDYESKKRETQCCFKLNKPHWHLFQRRLTSFLNTNE